MRSFALLLSILLVNTALAADPRPNILYFYCDDMGWGSIGPNAQAERQAKGLPYVRTPNLDALARQGVNFTRGYGCHVCSPARSSQQSGFHQGHTFADRNDPNNAKKAMRADEILMGDALQAAGYATGYWGKWGYGGSKSQDDPVLENIQTLPTSHGYEHVLAELHHVRAHTFFQPTLWNAPAPRGSLGGLQLVANSMDRYRGNAKYPSTPALQSHKDYPRTAYCDDAYAFAALDFVRTQGQRYHETQQPFFGLLAVQVPHAPFDEISALPDWDQAYADDPLFAKLADQTQQWAAMVTRIDAHFGNILAALEDPNGDGDKSDSVAANTLVVFQSDNGGPRGKNNVELDANGGLSGVKGTIQEGGIRVPLVMRWPAMIHQASTLKPGTSTDRVVDVTDLLPTFCEVAGVEQPLGIDGVSIAPTLLSTPGQRKREFIIHEANNGQSIIRGNYKLILGKKSKPTLYDLGVDPAEALDIAADHPDLVKELKSLLLGERVAEPRGFANTYHHWIGADGAEASSADNWSDYIYENAGETYLTDVGAPRLSWVAKIGNSVKDNGGQPSVARADADLEFLALQIEGEETAPQSLLVTPDVKLTGRNEIRVASHAKLLLDRATLSTLRWVDVLPGGVLQGSGQIDGVVYNQGAVVVSAGRSSLMINGDYDQSPDAKLTLSDAASPLTVSGQANLSGELTIANVLPGDARVVLQAGSVTGTFANVTFANTNGRQYAVEYSSTAVTIRRR